VANTLDYYFTELITTVKFFIEEAFGEITSCTSTPRKTFQCYDIQTNKNITNANCDIPKKACLEYPLRPDFKGKGGA